MSIIMLRDEYKNTYLYVQLYQVAHVSFFYTFIKTAALTVLL